MSITVENLSFSYGNHKVLDNISFSVRQGDFLSVLGPNGVGKSTLFRCIMGLLKPESGVITLDNKSIASYTGEQLAKRIAYIPQSHSPVFNYSVEDMVLMGTTGGIGPFASPGKAQFKLAGEAMEKIGISHLKNRPYNNISGGERQLCLIARAIAQQAKILIMDEPSASLDFGNRIKVMQTVRSLTDAGYTVIQSTHDPEGAYMYSDKILALHKGRILARGKPEDVITSDVISALYGVKVQVIGMENDKMRVCMPDFNIKSTGGLLK